MPEVVRDCPLCGCNHSTHFDSCSFRGRPVINRICSGCGLVFQSPRMNEAESAAFYATEYRSMLEGSPAPTARNIAIQNARAESLLGFIRPVLPAVSRHLDIGCSLGILLRYIQGHYHNQSVGVEPGEAHRNHARHEGLSVYPTLEGLVESQEGRFDLVSMSHVLEHLPDPVGTLSRLRESVLAPEGCLLLEVPNLYAHDSFEVAHLIAFSPHTLQEVVDRSGYRIEKYEKHGRPNSEILPLFLTMLCRPTQASGLHPIHPERSVKFKRWAGMLNRSILGRLFPHRAWHN